MKYIFYIFIFLGSTALSAQKTFQPKPVVDEEVGIIYKKEQNFQARLHTNGVALGYMFGKIKTYDVTDYYTFEFGFTKHPQQFRKPLQSLVIGTGPYYHGKIIAFMQMKFGYKKRKYLSEKAKRSGISIGYSYELYGILGMKKPYYLRVDDIDAYGGSIKYEDDPKKFLDVNVIRGSDNFFRGVKEIKFTPGIGGRFDIVFAWGAFEKFSRSIEAGFTIDLYPEEIKIMANEETSRIFANFHLNFIFGGRK